MRARVLVVALAIVALAALALGRGPNRRPAAPGGGGPGAAPGAKAPAPAPPVVDPEAIRDLFHSADASPRLAERPARARAEVEQPAPAPPTGPRLVGLVNRGGRLVAALAAEGEVLLAGPGETAAGVTVVGVSEDGVRIRRADGTEEVLFLP